jgi:hypothetical protein
MSPMRQEEIALVWLAAVAASGPLPNDCHTGISAFACPFEFGLNRKHRGFGALSVTIRRAPNPDPASAVSL